MDKVQKPIPVIETLPEGTSRPLWSVMIPTFNCAYYTRKTLESVLSQDPGPEKMQIEVVDDGSQDDIESVVQQLGKGRVLFFRQPQNVGVTKNFNTCLRRSRGQLVHILHGDDYVADGFYEAVKNLAEDYSATAFFYTRVFHVDEDDHLHSISPRIPELEKDTHDPSFLFYQSHVFTPGVVVRRNFYEKSGGFCESLCHTADYEMWIRAISESGGVMLNQPLAFYRRHEKNDTSRLIKKGDHLRDYLSMMKWINPELPGFSEKKADALVARAARDFMSRAKACGDHEAFEAYLRIWRKCTSWKSIIKSFLRQGRHISENIIYKFSEFFDSGK